ncbi:MAG: type II secretion system F family protein [Deltaproteobacteria bacterium]
MVRMEMLISFLAFVAIMLFSIGISSYIHYRRERWELSKRIKRMSGGIIRSEEITHFLYGIKDHLLGLVGSLGNLFRFKGKKESSLRDRFLKAGYRTEDISVVFSGLRVVLAILFFGIFPAMKLWIIKNLSSFQFILFSFILAIMGFYLPNLWLKWRIAKRKEKILEGFPDALDLMVVCLEVGTGLDAAISRVGEEMKLSNKVLSEEFKLLSLELRAGKHRRDALKNLALRTDLEDVSGLVTLLIQTDKFGTSVAQALRVHSDSMRIKRYQRAEEVATKLPVKLLFPLILFIFPSLFVILLGPAAIQIFRTLLPRMAGQ